MSERTLEKKMIGRPVEELPTPALVADLEALEANLTLLSGYFSGKACKLRPHFKSHKCVTLARRQLACANTVGITCAKVSEAEKLVEGGVKDVLVANQLIGRDKVRRAAALNRRATVRVAVDSAEGVRQLGKAASELEVTVGVLVEVDVGMNRCGVKPGAPSMELARLAARTRGPAPGGAWVSMASRATRATWSQLLMRRSAGKKYPPLLGRCWKPGPSWRNPACLSLLFPRGAAEPMISPEISREWMSCRPAAMR